MFIRTVCILLAHVNNREFCWVIDHLAVLTSGVASMADVFDTCVIIDVFA